MDKLFMEFKLVELQACSELSTATELLQKSHWDLDVALNHAQLPVREDGCEDMVIIPVPLRSSFNWGELNGKPIKWKVYLADGECLEVGKVACHCTLPSGKLRPAALKIGYSRHARELPAFLSCSKYITGDGNAPTTACQYRLHNSQIKSLVVYAGKLTFVFR